MGTFQIACQVEHPARRKRSTRVSKILVDTGSEHTWVSEQTLRKLGIRIEKKDVRLLMANGETVTGSIGFAIIRVDNYFTIDEVVFAQEGDLQLLGARTLEGLNLRADARQKKLVAGGPLPAAGIASQQGKRDRLSSERGGPFGIPQSILQDPSY